MEAQQRKLVRATTESASRLADEKASVATALDTAAVKGQVQRAAKPNSLAGGMKKAGVALLVAPDPITDVAGVALLAGSVAMKRSEPAGLDHLAAETRKMLKDLQSLRL